MSKLDNEELIRRVSRELMDSYDEELEMEVEDRDRVPLPEGADEDRQERGRRRRKDREDSGERTGIFRLRRDRGEDIWPDDGISDEDYWASVAADRPLNAAGSPLDDDPLPRPAAGGEKGAGHLPRRCAVERGVPLRLLGIGIGPGANQPRRQLGLAGHRGVVEQCLTARALKPRARSIALDRGEEPVSRRRPQDGVEGRIRSERPAFDLHYPQIRSGRSRSAEKSVTARQ